jgi:hypothetical protein
MKTSQLKLLKTTSFKLVILTGILITPYGSVFATPAVGGKQKPLLEIALNFSQSIKNQNEKSATTSNITTENNPENNPITVSENTDSEDTSHLDPDHEISKTLLDKAIGFYKTHSTQIRNKSTLGIIDFSKKSSEERFYLVDMVSGKIDSYLVAHGKNSDKNYDGYATEFSNSPNSLMSSQGFYLTAETYSGEHGYSLRLDGLSSTNSNARIRNIVIHAAKYVEADRDVIGRSLGCPAIDSRYSREVINRIKGGTLIFAQ